MKRSVLLGALIWTLFISVAHVQLNVGWGRLAQHLRVWFAGERAELVVGFLPVT